MGRGRTPHGVRGLKFMGMHDNVGIELSPPTPGGGVEMALSPLYTMSTVGLATPPPQRGAGGGI